MDPVTAVGLVASAAQLGDCTIRVVGSILFYVSEVKDAPSRSAELRDELNTMSEILVGVKKVLETCTDNLPSDTLDSLDDTFTNVRVALQDILEKVEGSVKPAQTQGLKRLNWPFKAHEIAAYIDRVQRYNAALISALNLQQLYSTIAFSLADLIVKHLTVSRKLFEGSKKLQGRRRLTS
jgi:hypothetical protein